ncbi:hypothetical protein SDC9_09286 [bioreactor metagenome]|uniref:CRP-like cAMP-activated global transcriptional regulator n=1 Tax=bioreactor metagenome TaxID=1076179 RepID=A0A644T9P9_9ZZZZ|nr:Crp/Fnr family transcriptional regulator [Desulfitobacterium hafniense]MEA5024176.1 Crp/Fnr family transcriptional regulator [Desulfitobacterium hafniense]
MQLAENIMPFRLAPKLDNSEIVWEEICRLSKPEKMAPNQYVIQPEEKVQYFYYLKEGRGRCFISWPDGSEHTLYLFDKGAIFGEMLLGDVPGSQSQWSVVTLDFSIVYKFNYQQITRIMADYPQIALSIIKSCLVKKKLLAKHIEDLSFKRTDVKIAELLCSMAEDYGDSNQELVVLLNQNDLAELVGVSRVTVSKILSRFQKLGAVAIRRGSVLILDKGKLLNVASLT